MNFKRALITGGAGLIGSHIADALVEQHVPEIIILDDFSRGRKANLANAAARGNLTIIEGNICDRPLVRELMEGVDLVFHEAALRITQCAENSRLAVDVLVNGTFNVVEAAVNSGVKKVISASSASIYGLAEKFPTPETHHAYNNRTIYGAAKLFNEGLLRSFHQMHGLDYLALRYFNVYGPRMDTHGTYTEVLIRWIESLAAGKPCVIFGDGTQTMDFVFVEDVARANIIAAASPATDEVFNVASGIEISLNELAATLGRIMGSTQSPRYEQARRVNPVTRRLADTRKLESLGFRATFSLEEGLRRLVRWWEQQRVPVSSPVSDRSEPLTFCSPEGSGNDSHYQTLD